MLRVVLRAALVAGLIGLAAPAFADGAAPITPFKDASRLIVIGGSLTEIVYALGEEKHLIARDTTGNYPEAATKLPDVGYMRALSPEGVLSVGPSAILAIAGSGPPEALAVIAKAGVPFVEVPEGFSADGILAKVRDVGAALGVPDKAEALAQKLATDLGAAAALTKDVSARKRVLFVLSLQGGKVLASGTGTAANAMIALAGGVNAVADYQGYKALNDEAIIAARPDLILMMANAGDDTATDAALLANPAVGLTPAGVAKNFRHIDGEYLLGFGPRTPAAIRELATDLYGDKIGGN